MYSKDLLEAVLQSADIVNVISAYLHVEKKGKNHVALCPFHDDKNPSLSISKEKQIFKCFVCGVGGDAIGFVQKFEKISYPEAVRKVAELSSFSDPRLTSQAPVTQISPEKARLYSCIDDLQTLYRYALSTEEASSARKYLDSRNLGLDMIERFKIGYAPNDGVKTIEFLRAKKHSLKEISDIGVATPRLEGTSDLNAGRIVFPLFSPRGQLVGFSTRRIVDDGSSKYINSPETPIFTKGENLYNYHLASGSARRDGYCYLVEGFMDVMSLYRAGIESAVAVMGTSLTSEQISLLKRLKCEIRLCLDGDDPGQRAMMKISMALQQAGIPHRIVDYEGDLRDPDDIYNEDGKEGLLKRLNNLKDPMEFYLSYYGSSKKERTVEERKRILMHFIPLLTSQKQGIEYEDTLQKLSRATGFDPDAIRRIASSSNTSVAEETPLLTLKAPQLRRKKMSRLQAAERNLLYYMLLDHEAIKIYQEAVGNFYDDTYRLAANYIIDYDRAHPGQLTDIASICALSAQDGNDDVSSFLAELSLEKSHEPSSEELLERYASTIAEEKKKEQSRLEVETSLEEGDELASLEALQQLLDQRRRSLKNHHNLHIRKGDQT